MYSLETQTALADAIGRADPIGLLAELVRIPSHPGIERQEERVVDALSRYLEMRGLSIEITEAAPGRPNLVCSLRGARAGRHLVLCGHTDTVPLNATDSGGGFSADIRDGYMYGRGTADMKGGIAAMAAALVALNETGLLPAGALTLAAIVDEEMESIGAEQFVRSGFRADGAIVGEPTSNRLCLGHKGLEWIEMEFRGRAAHGGTPRAGVNAIVGAASFIERVNASLLPKLEARAHPLLGPPTINFGTIRGGDQPSTVAAHCMLSADRRSVPGETADTIFGELRELLDEVGRQMPGLETELRRFPGGMAAMEHVACVTEKTHPLASATAQACSDVKRAPEVPTAFPAWTDGALLAAFGGIPSIVLGPGELSVAHSPRERVSIDEVKQAALIYAMAAIRFAEATL